MPPLKPSEVVISQRRMTPFRMAWVAYFAVFAALLATGVGFVAMRLAAVVAVDVVAVLLIGVGCWRSRIVVTDHRIDVRHRLVHGRMWSGTSCQAGIDTSALLGVARRRRSDIPVVEVAGST